MAIYTFDQAVDRATQVLEAAGAKRAMAFSTAKGLVKAEAQGLPSHGLSRLKQYASHLSVGRVNPLAQPSIIKDSRAGVLIDADEGLAFPACELAIAELILRAKEYGIGFAGVTRSHHFGMASLHLDAVAQAGMVGLAFSNSPSAMPAWGGKTALFGTNPIAAVFPRHNKDPISIDMSLSEVARGKLMVAAQKGQEIPLGWGLDRDGQPTTDPKVAMQGMMCPMGGVKGSMLALTVELLCVALTGASFGFEADSFFEKEGNRPHLGHVFLAINPGALAGNEIFNERIETLVSAMLLDPDVRLPGSRRNAIMVAADNKLELADSLFE
jgi:(2R)-3-sulfolactate dehydrogenase (NADP+)